jgi:toxin ParE1/3/4
MARVLVVPAADEDIEDILADLARKAGHATATRYGGLFDQLYDRLAAHPAIGPRRPALGPDIRIGIVSPYIVIYRFTDDDNTVTVLRVVHGRRRITAGLLAVTEP